MLLVKLDTGFNIEVEFAITPFHKRFLAWCLDIVILVSYFMIVNKILESLITRNWESRTWLLVMYGLPPLFYHLACEVWMNGQSIGKKALGIKVLTLDGGQPSLSQYLIRWVFRLADFPTWLFAFIFTGALPWYFAVLLVGGIVCVVASKYSQRIGDLVAGTIIIDARTRTSWTDTVFTELADDYQPSYPQVMKLTDKDINTLKSIIDTVQKRNDYDLSMRIADRIRSKLGIDSDRDSLDFLQTLLKDYNYYSTR
jgi:uncharacterized RDD family membrane protein YckC